MKNLSIIGGVMLGLGLMSGMLAASAAEKNDMPATQGVSCNSCGMKTVDGQAGTAPVQTRDYNKCSCPASQMLFNPAFGDDIYHTHPAGCWMVGYKYMHMEMRDLRAGANNVGLDQVGFMRNKPYEYMMIPTGMTMDMHMLMAMYGINDRFTLMGMANYQANEMKMLMDMGPMMPITRESPMRTSGMGDTELRGICKINEIFVGSLGVSLPTGSTDQETTMMRYNFRAPYDMQLGSGTYDLKPALTYNDLSKDEKWDWGAQAMYAYHIGRNDKNYSLGDSIKANGWLQRAFGPAAAWLRLAFNDTERISGQDDEIQKLLYRSDPSNPKKWAPTPDADPNNYGGQRFDGAIGASCQIGPCSVGIEGGAPLYQYANGLQLKADWFLTVGVQAMF